MAKTIKLELTESAAEALEKVLTKKIGALQWVIENKDPKEPEKLEASIKEFEGIKNQLK